MQASKLLNIKKTIMTKFKKVLAIILESRLSFAQVVVYASQNSFEAFLNLVEGECNANPEAEAQTNVDNVMASIA